MDLSVSDTVFVDGGVFYIGYKQPLTDELILGLDGNNDTWDQLYVFTNGSWNQNVIIHGSLMIRPVIGERGTTDIITDVENPQKSQSLLYPNPTNGDFFIQGPVLNLAVTDLTGRSVPFTSQQQESGSQVTLHSPAAGFYLVRWNRNSQMILRKIIVRH